MAIFESCDATGIALVGSIDTASLKRVKGDPVTTVRLQRAEKSIIADGFCLACALPGPQRQLALVDQQRGVGAASDGLGNLPQSESRWDRQFRVAYRFYQFL